MHSSALGEVAHRHQVLLLVLFGSTAKGARRPGSDLDLAVLFGGTPREESWLWEEAQLSEDLGQLLPRGLELDLVVLNIAGPPVQKAIADHGLLLFEDEPGRWTGCRIRARRMYEDTEKYRRRRWEAAARRLGIQT